MNEPNRPQDSTIRLSPRADFKELVFEQISTINRLRSQGDDWSEAVEALADLLIPIYDEDFKKAWDRRRVACIDVDGLAIPTPTPQDNREAYTICMDLMARKGTLVPARRQSWVGSDNEKPNGSPVRTPGLIPESTH